MESLGIMLFGNQYQGRRVLVTGHTGFKGSWLALWLTELGANVAGLALPPSTTPNHWDLLQLDINHYLQDIRDSQLTAEIIAKLNPEIIFHLAAQPLVRHSYREPLQTWSSNVMGTANILEACRHASDLKAIVVVTSDKCYENQEWCWPYREIDRLGGYDPYSASKAATELVVASYRQSFFNTENSPLLASARAGNVIGGGDWSEDRLIPDLVRSIRQNQPLIIRSPNATRPWQHILESLSGYLLLGQHLLAGQRDKANAWNFGPDKEGNCTVAELLNILKSHWSDVNWQQSEQQQLHEANLLYLDSSKAKMQLGWQPVWKLADALHNTSSWFQNYYASGKLESREQLSHYIAFAQASGIIWCQ